MITAQLKVIEIARIKKSCRRCEKMVQVPAPSRPIPGSMAGGPNLLAHVLVSKLIPLVHVNMHCRAVDHLPLYRQNEIFARLGADIPDSTLVDWCGRSMQVLQPIIERIEAHVMASDLLHTPSRDISFGNTCRAMDDTPIRVLDRSRRDKGLGKGVKQGRIWAYVRDPLAGSACVHAREAATMGGQRPPAGGGGLLLCPPDRKGEHVRQHLQNSSGILQADAYAGFNALYEKGSDGKSQFREAACWAHLRRDFHDIWASDKSQIAREALDRIGKLYDIEREIAGQAADTRLATRQKLSKPKVEAFKHWAEQQLTRIPGKSDLAKAFAMV